MKGKFKLNHLIVHLILLVGVIVVVFPFAWMILTSFKTSGEAMKIPGTESPEIFFISFETHNSVDYSSM